MTMIVEDGTGLTNSNSYASLSEAEDYLTIKGAFGESWFELGSSEQEFYLQWSSRLLDQRANFVGSKYVQESALRWPRQGAVDRDGISLPYDEIPVRIKDATIEIAYHLLSKGLDPSGQPTTDSSGKIKKIKADVVEIEYESVKAVSEVAMYFPFGINQLLSPIGSIPSGNGSRFGRILKA